MLRRTGFTMDHDNIFCGAALAGLQDADAVVRRLLVDFGADVVHLPMQNVVLGDSTYVRWVDAMPTMTAFKLAHIAGTLS